MKRLLFFLSIFLFLHVSVFASHFIGGDVHFEQTGANQFKITVRVFRDFCNGIDADAEIDQAGIYDRSTNTLITNVTLPLTFVDTIDLGDDCFTPTGICVEVNTYEGTVTLPNNPNGYYFTYHNFARNNAIVNMNPDGMTWVAYIPDPAIAGGNTNPRFKAYPSDAYFCVGVVKELDFSCIDPDGDSLVYSLVQPLDEGPNFSNTSPINTIPVLGFQPGYSMSNILGPGSLLTINSATGIITARPGAIGVFLFRVRCDEYRNGVLIGSVFGDFQYEAPNCTFDIPPTIPPFSSQYSLELDGGNYCIDLVGVDANPSDSVYLSITTNANTYGANFSLPPANQPAGTYTFSYTDTTNNTNTSHTTNILYSDANYFIGRGKVGAKFCWDPTDCDILALDTFGIQMNVISIGCDGIGDTLAKDIKLNISKAKKDGFVPNVFSPNGDSKNDLFTLPSYELDKCYDVVNVEIYNRWGVKVFESQDPLFAWDGKDKSGSNCSPGTYFVILQGYFGGEEVTDQFQVTLFR